MSELKTCRVAYRDSDGTVHSVDVVASTLYEAAVLGNKAFQIADWSENPIGFLEITVSAPVVKHQVSIAKLTAWLESARSPRELVMKTRLKEILGWKG
jgi:hypothetical protein